MVIAGLPRMVIKGLEAIVGESFTIVGVQRLPSRRNEVYKIEGVFPPNTLVKRFVAKFFHTPGIAQETSILQHASLHQIPVPPVVGTTTNLLVMEYIDAPNLCDLITLYPALHYAHLLASWFAQYHNTFTRTENQVLLKGDARIRNFLIENDHAVGVDFEESHTGMYAQDLAVVCGSILDTTPMFTPAKRLLCQEFLKWYSLLRPTTSLDQLTSETTSRLIEVLQVTAHRREQPSELQKKITLLKRGGFKLSPGS